MSNPDAQIDAFVQQAGWEGAELLPLAGDLSSRRYIRLRRAPHSTSILMNDTDRVSFNAFLHIGEWLRSIGLSAPEVLEENRDAGLLLLEDFGDAKLSSLIAKSPSRQKELTDAAVDVLLTIRRQKEIALAHPSPDALIEATRLIDEWYPNVGMDALNTIRESLRQQLKALSATPPSVSLRDFHTDNLIWLPERTGAARIGILDFQDAFLAHPAYDLMSLVTDARIDVPREVVAQALERFSVSSGLSVAETKRAVSVLGVQRNLRILGIFLRSAKRDGKRHHLPSLPRVRNHVARCLEHPALSSVAHLLDQAIPPIEEQLT